MKIIELRAENVKRLKVVEIRPSGALVEISGRNGQGKSSVLDAIWWALAGAGNVQKAPIRKGTTEARIRVDLGEIKVTRTFKKSDDKAEFTTSIVVENELGARFPSPQKMLDGLLGQLSFDPLAFARMDAKAQFDALKSFVPGVDFAAIEQANKADFDTRTAVNRRVKELTTQFLAIKIPTDAPAERIDDAEIVAQLERAGQHNAEIERRKARREQAAANITTAEATAERDRSRAAELRSQAEYMEKQAADQDQHVADLRAKLDGAEPLPAPIDTAEIRQRIGAARATNEAFDAKARAEADRDRIAAEGKQAEAQAAALTAAIERRNAEKAAAIAAAEMPIKGIAFGDGEILLDDVPFDQASDAERLRTSIAIAIAANPKLRVIRVRDGSLLDTEAMKLLAEMAEANDMQVWIETVGDAGKVGFILEDGMIRGSAEHQQAAE